MLGAIFSEYLFSAGNKAKGRKCKGLASCMALQVCFVCLSGLVIELPKAEISVQGCLFANAFALKKILSTVNFFAVEYFGNVCSLWKICSVRSKKCDLWCLQYMRAPFQ